MNFQYFEILCLIIVLCSVSPGWGLNKHRKTIFTYDYSITLLTTTSVYANRPQVNILIRSRKINAHAGKLLDDQNFNLDFVLIFGLNLSIAYFEYHIATDYHD